MAFLRFATICLLTARVLSNPAETCDEKTAMCTDAAAGDAPAMMQMSPSAKMPVRRHMQASGQPQTYGANAARPGASNSSSPLMKGSAGGTYVPIQIEEDGVWNQYYLSVTYGPQTTVDDGKGVQYGGSKSYLMKTQTNDYSDADNFKKLSLPGKTLTVDIDYGSNPASCGCNVNFFLVDMPATSPGEFGDYYCDANCVGGNCCSEFDLDEANGNAFQVTNHACSSATSGCNGGGTPELKWNSGNGFGIGDSYSINTKKPFTYSIDFKEENAGTSNANLVITVTLTQGDNSLSHVMSGGEVNTMWQYLAAGMVLVVDYWDASNMFWLDQPPCSGTEVCNYASSTLSNIRITSNTGSDDSSSDTTPSDDNTPSSDDTAESDDDPSCGCPSADGYDCSWATNSCGVDDGSEGWCRCCCPYNPNTWQCQWSGYHGACAA